MNITSDLSITLGRKFDAYDLVVISFELAGCDFYYILKDRVGEDHVITTTLPNLGGYECIFTASLPSLGDRDRINIVQLILKRFMY